MRGGHAVRVLVRSSRRVLEAAVLDLDDGTYEASFSCVDAGPLQLAMSVEGRAVPSAEAMRLHVAAAAPHSLHLAPCAPAVRSLFDTSVPPTTAPTTAPIGWSGLPWNSSLGSIMEPSAETLFPHGRLRLVSGVEDLSDWGPGSGSAALGSGAPRTPSTVIDAMVDASSRTLPMRAVPSAPSVRAVPVGRSCFFELRATDAYGNPCELTPEMVDVSAVPSAEEMEVVVITDETPPPLDHPGRLRVRVRVTALAARRHKLVARCAGLEASVGVEGVSLVNAAVSDAPTPNGIEP
jgi:hypothetical protein